MQLSLLQVTSISEIPSKGTFIKVLLGTNCTNATVKHALLDVELQATSAFEIDNSEYVQLVEDYFSNLPYPADDIFCDRFDMTSHPEQMFAIFEIEDIIPRVLLENLHKQKQVKFKVTVEQSKLAQLELFKHGVFWAGYDREPLYLDFGFLFLDPSYNDLRSKVITTSVTGDWNTFKTSENKEIKVSFPKSLEQEDSK